jgi:glycosyltransferase involved in cell wall biosynthesis
VKVLYLIHGHERFSKGGAEAAAFSLFNSVNNLADCDCWILSAYPNINDAVPLGNLQSIDKHGREYILGAQCEYFYLKSINIAAIKPAISRLIAEIKPDIIHLHHFINFGIDVIPLLQTLIPSAKIVVTLHEYLALCLHNGQMVTTNSLSLCEEPSPLSCSNCFPDKNPNDIFLRLTYASTVLKGVDQLISPSEFLIKRFKQSGVDHPHFSCIENGLPMGERQTSSDELTAAEPSGSLNRFSFFGQINQYKGLLVLLKAVNLLKQRKITDFLVIINGANLEMQPANFQDSFNDLLRQSGDLVLMAGSYGKEELKSRMLHSDWTIVPSTWWENSPVVIQESFSYMRPVIGSNIGGISEKIRDKGGIEFEVGNSLSLANTIESCSGNHELYCQLQRQIPKPFTAELCAEQHRRLYQDLIAKSAASSR